MLRVLCISFDEAVSRARVALLKRRGYAITATLHAQEAVRLLAFEKFDLVIVGHRFAKTERQHLAEMARGKNAAVVLICGPSAEGDITVACERVYALEGMAGLERALDRLQPHFAPALG